MREGPEPEVRGRTNSKNGREDHKSGVRGQNLPEKLMRGEKKRSPRAETLGLRPRETKSWGPGAEQLEVLGPYDKKLRSKVKNV